MRSSLTKNKNIRVVTFREESPYKTGVAHGRLLKQELKMASQALHDLAGEEYGRIFGKAALRFFLIWSKRHVKRLPKEYRAEVQGISDGSGVDLKWIAFANAIHDLSTRIRKVIVACSAFIAPSVELDSVVFAKTTDLYLPEKIAQVLADIRAVFVYDSAYQRNKFLLPAFCGCLAGDSGILSNGLTFGFNDGGSGDKKIYYGNQAVTTVVRQIAETTRTISEIVSLMKNTKIMKSYTLLATDGSERGSILVDMANDNVDEHRLHNYLINTNTFRTEEMRERHYSEKWLEVFPKHNSPRYKSIENNLPKKATLEDVKNILQIHDENFCHREGGSISNKGTVQGIVSMPKQRKVYFPNEKKVPVTLTNSWTGFSLGDLFTN